MEERTFRSGINPEELANALVAHFGQGMTQARRTGRGTRTAVEIVTRHQRGEPHASVTATITQSDEGVIVAVKEGSTWGVAADLAQIGLKAFFRPLSIIGEIDDVARDLSKLNLPAEVWKAVETYSRSVELLPEDVAVRDVITCRFCGAGVPVGVGQCPACGAPLGDQQPSRCPKCGKTLRPGAKFCLGCGLRLAGV